jgi:hypothetical protein
MAMRGVRNKPANKLPETAEEQGMWTLHLQTDVFSMTDRVIFPTSVDARER